MTVPTGTGAATGTGVRVEQVAGTRKAILATAERLFAEHGVAAVSARQISEAAGQGNNAAVGYHFGTKTDLVRAVLASHSEPIEERRAQLVAEHAGSTELRDWLNCLVLPSAEHFASLPVPTWFARFSAQLMTDPVLRALIEEQSLDAPSLHQVLDGMRGCLSGLPTAVRHERGEMARLLLVHAFAEREREAADGEPVRQAGWVEATASLVDALVGLFLAPTTADVEQRMSTEHDLRERERDEGHR
ncbi:TetR/AcrR family transcriptional regulator [Promicromonospora panici]|uniref:TetR/AcrR family transcriptional regulator n=1 Tax=Promicromonospora panici TaxID=2219658 RepID=UPI001A929209|nr:helix-turn-helix domain-containing protein [Promicromonospora panici]